MLLLAFNAALALSMGYLLALLLAAFDARRRSAATVQSQPDADLRLVVLIPAHDEEGGISATLASLESCQARGPRARVVVIADNCTDRTATRARDAGVEVWERWEPSKRGKGLALAWGLQRLSAEQFDAVVILDADCSVSSNLLDVIGARIDAGAKAVQVSYQVGNPRQSRASALRFVAFSLMNTVRPLGKQRLGLSSGLFGSGMAFTSELLQRVPWTVVGMVEDFEYHMLLVLYGERVEFAPEASVSSSMPLTLHGGAEQHARWELGKLQIIRSWSPRLVRAGIANRDPLQLHAGLEQLVPPQSLILAGSACSALAGIALRSRRLFALCIATMSAQIVFVLGGLRLVHAPAEVYRALLAGPALVLGKIVLYARLLLGMGPRSWNRTERSWTERS